MNIVKRITIVKRVVIKIFVRIVFVKETASMKSFAYIFLYV
mgnify:CR=1 FL=1